MGSVHQPSLRVAIVHDWLTNLGGAERVVLELCQMFPGADLYTSVYRPRKLKLFTEAGIRVRTSFLQHWPLASRHQLYPVLRRLAFESFDFQGYDVVITSNTAESKGIIVPDEAVHICYMNTPTRYYWSHYAEYLKEPGFGLLNPLVRIGLKAQIRSARRWDYAAAQRPDVILGNSKTVQARIQQYYDRESTVVYPPVDYERFTRPQTRPQAAPEKYFIVVSRLIPYKRVDLAIAAAERAGVHLVVIGRGSQAARLKAQAGENVHILGSLSDDEVVAYMQHAQALIFPGEEDFGITPVEAMAAGTPVIAYGKGGAAETVLDGETGRLVPRQSVSAFTEAINEFDAGAYDPSALRRRAADFSLSVFRAAITEEVVRSGRLPQASDRLRARRSI